MSLSSLQLDAFHEVARTKNFSQAADHLHVTQSALSQRVLNLEEDLGVSLFLRSGKSVELTSQGERLLRYCEARSLLESEARTQIETGRQVLSGTIRIAGFSTVTRSLVIPALADFIHKHPHIGLEISSRELHELPGLLKSGQADFVLTSSEIHAPSVRSTLLGYEQNVLIKRKKGTVIEDVFIDHDARDEMTLQFFKQQKKSLQPKTFRRFYLDEIESIVAAVKLGLGRAVVPLHLIEKDSDLEIDTNFKTLESAIYLHQYEQILATKLQTSISELLQLKFSKVL